MQQEIKILREKLNGFQQWMEDQIDKGLMNIGSTPSVFDKARYMLRKEEENTTTIGKCCHFCESEFKNNEIKKTDNHIMFFHLTCKILWEKAEEISLTRQDK